MNTKFITASVFTFVSASIVQAADVVVPEQPEHVASSVIVSPPFSWTGFYFGGQVGGFSSKLSATAPDVDIPLFPDKESKDKKWVPLEKEYLPELSGFVGGLYLGANMDLGNNFILGIDTDILLSGRKDTKTKVYHAGSAAAGGGKTPESGKKSAESPESGTDTDGGADTDEGTTEQNKRERGKKLRNGVNRDVGGTEKDSVTVSHKLKEKWVGATRIRVGFSADRIMPYISGGIAYGQFQDILSTSVTGKEPFSATSDDTKMMIGYTLGGGVDFAVADNVILRAEYRYSDFGKKKFKDEIELKYKTNDLRIGVAYKF
ncbi:outer membrane protein [Bartonella taylorii]|uniref:Porin n=1 Tax=Bartonella taylorii TaxID=33046 RepID=A0A9Q8Z0J8_BARTA|nr:outer membrane protein [Bartonella taylorii]OPB34763.1 Outer membrane protein beta-barrel domain-containing protein [Bartonella taylorii]USP03305.1 porin family protein [Bartonella taylorii]